MDEGVGLPPPADRTPFRPSGQRSHQDQGGHEQGRRGSGAARVRVGIGVAAWWLAAATAVAAVGLALAHARGRRDGLVTEIVAGGHAGGHSVATLTHVAQVTVQACLVWLVVVALLEVLLAQPAVARRAAAGFLSVVGLLDAAALTVVVSVLSPPGWGVHAGVRWVLVAHGALTVIALVALLSPAARRSRRARRP